MSIKNESTTTGGIPGILSFPYIPGIRRCLHKTERRTSKIVLYKCSKIVGAVAC